MRRLGAAPTAVACGLLLQIGGLMPASVASAAAESCSTAGCPAPKNDLGQLSDLKPYFDFAINEQCFQFKECNFPAPGLPDWTASGKAVFNVEYKSSALDCTQAASYQISSILKPVDLFGEPWTPCA